MEGTHCRIGQFQPRDANATRHGPSPFTSPSPSLSLPCSPRLRAFVSSPPQGPSCHTSKATLTARPRWQCHKRVLLRKPSFRRHARRTRQLASRVPVRNHTLAGDALTAYRILGLFCMFIYSPFILERCLAPSTHVHNPPHLAPARAGKNIAHFRSFHSCARLKPYAVTNPPAAPLEQRVPFAVCAVTSRSLHHTYTQSLSLSLSLARSLSRRRSRD